MPSWGHCPCSEGSIAAPPGSRLWKAKFFSMLCVLVLGRDTWGHCMTDMGSGTYWPLSVTVADTQLMTIVSLSLVLSALHLFLEPCLCIRSLVLWCGCFVGQRCDHEQPVPPVTVLCQALHSVPLHMQCFVGVYPHFTGEGKKDEGASEPKFGLRLIYGGG